ncbi:hypothetical protein BEP19_01760 [Ammoniphilus oxalaticus]|uniref:ABC transporter periplasmic binding protein yphF n=2 Tax=Ammoniphilus oxalaticus TaxID=66863 RepID=A0A419SP91_9BACL|nr:hypothetical protein BEP19_01760 [Ammoniphilus oxalaticus]
MALALLLTGCMYPQERRMENQLPIEQQVSLVQDAVEAYQTETGVLPIVTRDASTPIYEKYPLDFQKLNQRYMPYIPGGAFEQGGPYLFVLTNVEVEPTVRLIDLRLADQVATIQLKIQFYLETKKEMPIAGPYPGGSGYQEIDFKKIGISNDKTTVVSPITGDPLPIILSADGVVGIDYQTDLDKISASNNEQLETRTELRDLIPDHSLYAPTKSFAYALRDGEIRLAETN